MLLKLKITPYTKLIILVLIPVIIDVLTGVLFMLDIDFPIGKIYRGLLYSIGVYYFFKNINKVFFYSIIPVLWFLLFLFWFTLSSNFSIFREFSFFFKVTYFFMIYFSLKGVNLDKFIKVEFLNLILKRYSQIIAVLIIFSFITGVGLVTYGKWVFGTSSFFIGQNDIGVTQLLIFTYLLFNKNRLKITWLWLLLIWLSLILLGTTTGMFGSIVIIISYLNFKLVLSKIISVNNLFFRMFLIIILLMTIIFSTIKLIDYVNNSPYYSKKYNKILQEGVRANHSKEVLKYYNNRNKIYFYFGEGFSSFTVNLGNSAVGLKKPKPKWLLAERDFHDVFGSYGLFLTLSIFIFYFYFLLLAIINYFNKRDINTLSILFIYSIAILHGYFAGHVFYSPTVSGVLAVFVYFIHATYHKIK